VKGRGEERKGRKRRERRRERERGREGERERFIIFRFVQHVHDNLIE